MNQFYYQNIHVAIYFLYKHLSKYRGKYRDF